MSQVIYPEAQSSHLRAHTDKVILITSGLQDSKHAEDLREEIRHFGLDCEIVPGDVSDPDYIPELIRAVFGCSHCIGTPVNDAETRRDLLIGKMTDEEWLAQ